MIWVRFHVLYYQPLLPIDPSFLPPLSLLLRATLNLLDHGPGQNAINVAR